MDTLVERCAGLDVHKDTVVACVRITTGTSVVCHSATFGTMTGDLLGLRDWLTSWDITLVGMESTGVYWKPVYYLLEDELGCWLLNARHLRNVPGRKTDMADAAWIAQLLAHGLVQPSFVPPKPIRELRNLTRYRKAQIDERGREAQRLDKILQDAGIKLSSVATDILGVSGRAMLAALVQGSRDPEALAELAKGLLRKKIPALREALTSRFGAHHALLVGEVLARLDYLDEAIGRLSVEIDQVIAPFDHQRDLLTTAVGIDRRTAEGLIAEIGVDMAVFGTAERLASWAGRCPGQHESAGKSKSGRTRKANKWLRIYLHDAAMGAIRSKGTYPAAQYARIKGRRVDTPRPSARSNTHCWWPASTCSTATSPTTTSEATTSPVYTTPNAEPDGSCTNSMPWATPSPRSRPPRDSSGGVSPQGGCDPPSRRLHSGDQAP